MLAHVQVFYKTITKLKWGDRYISSTIFAKHLHIFLHSKFLGINYNQVKLVPMDILHNLTLSFIGKCTKCRSEFPIFLISFVILPSFTFNVHLDATVYSHPLFCCLYKITLSFTFCMYKKMYIVHCMWSKCRAQFSPQSKGNFYTNKCTYIYATMHVTMCWYIFLHQKNVPCI